jgi:acetylornithine deacetylase/succinyl-diaminopimelate desuccinylase-like protein
VTDLDGAIHDLADWLRIPSVSTSGGNGPALREAAEWALRKIVAAGGTAELSGSGHPPLVVGELRAVRADAPTVLIYGHYDVQDVGDPSRWTSDPFEPDIRDGRIYARGASDDKGNFLPLLLVACEMADAGQLGVNVRILLEGEEETPADTAERWMAADERGADAAIVFDAGMVDADTPALTVGTRGMVWADLVVTTGERPAHSGEFGGAALNAVHVLNRILAAVLPDEHGRPPEPLRAGITPPSQAELDSWAKLPHGGQLLADAGAQPHDDRAGEELHLRTMAGASVDVHRVAAGEARTIVPERAEASLSVRLAGGQRGEEIAHALETLLRDALAPGAELELHLHGAEPSRFDPEAPALLAARRALEQASGIAPAVVRSGGSIPILAAFAERGIPTIVGGFALADDRIHAPDESYRIASLELGLRSARALYEELAASLPCGGAP